VADTGEEGILRRGESAKLFVGLAQFCRLLGDAVVEVRIQLPELLVAVEDLPQQALQGARDIAGLVRAQDRQRSTKSLDLQLKLRDVGAVLGHRLGGVRNAGQWPEEVE
jgi:hypothetical protein